MGDQVVAYLGWQEYGVSDGTGVYKVDTRHVPLSAYLGPVGMPGVTAWYGLNRIIEPKAGRDGPRVGSQRRGRQRRRPARAARRLPRDRHRRRRGKVQLRHRQELQFDACIDYKSEDVGKRLKEVAPQGVDGYFENVGGEIMDAVLPRMNAFGRIALCGLIAGYDGRPIPISNPTLVPDQPPAC